MKYTSAYDGCRIGPLETYLIPSSYASNTVVSTLSFSVCRHANCIAARYLSDDHCAFTTGCCCRKDGQKSEGAWQ